VAAPARDKTVKRGAITRSTRPVANPSSEVFVSELAPRSAKRPLTASDTQTTSPVHNRNRDLTVVQITVPRPSSAAPISQRSPDHDGATRLQATDAAGPYSKAMTHGLAPEAEAQGQFSRLANPLMPRATRNTSCTKTAPCRTLSALQTLF
jgi:hypothetical protein